MSVWVCNACWQENDNDETDCKWCGAPHISETSMGEKATEELVIICPSCGRQYPASYENIKICESCGAKNIREEKPQPKPVQQQGAQTGQMKNESIAKFSICQVRETESKENHILIPLLNKGKLDYISKEITIERDKCIFGRNSLGGGEEYCYISEEHCRFEYKNGWYVSDTDSKNGTWLNRKRLAPGEERLIEDKSTIQLADKLFQVSLR